MWVLSCFSRVQLSVTLWTVARLVLCPWDFPGKNTGVGYHFLLQDLPDPGIKPASLAFQADSLPTGPPRKPNSADLYLLPHWASQVAQW